MIKNTSIMKTYTAIAATCMLLLLNACKKDKSDRNTLVNGKWMQIGNYISNGGPLDYVAAKGTPKYAEFNAGVVSGTAFPDYKQYTVKDNATITLTSADKTKYENYQYKLREDTLTMSPIGPEVCMEGCAVVFVKD